MAKHTRKRTSKRSTSKRSHRNKKHGGGKNNAVANNAVAINAAVNNAADPVEVPVEINATQTEVGGRRKTRKVSKGASDWNKKVMMVYHEMKKKNPSVKLGAAMKECSKRKKRGEL